MDYRNFELLKLVMTKLMNETFQFRNKVIIANKNIDAIYATVQSEDIVNLTKMINQDDGLIVRLNMKDLIPTEQCPKSNVDFDQNESSESSSSSEFSCSIGSGSSSILKSSSSCIQKDQNRE